ncbi:MAG TPA: cation transporter, partial [Syntrophorhabdus aromaticivorans]|nr:cation transporter [Syntrophorhabdus aromaticivorans]
MSLTKFLLRMFVKDHENVSDERVRMRYGYLEAWVSIVGNVVIALINFFFGVTLNSIALIAQSVHTASDVVTSVVVLIGFKVAAQPADEKHPYGHGRVETIATLIIAILLLIVGFEFAGKAISRMIHGAEVKGNIPVVLVLLGVGAAKEWMARFATKLGRAI